MERLRIGGGDWQGEKNGQNSAHRVAELPDERIIIMDGLCWNTAF